jgi:hypothetical protein
VMASTTARATVVTVLCSPVRFMLPP